MHSYIRTVFFVSICLASLALPEALYAERLFDSHERRSTRLKSFPKWTGMLKKYDNEVTGKECSPSNQKCLLKKWNSFLSSLQTASPLQQMKEINHYLNQTPYIIDQINWGVPDYWATPYQFYIKNGDCEDYAIAKYMSLKALGFNPREMRVVVLMDNNLNIHHSVLAVWLNERIYILDNQIQQVVEDKKIHHYKPIYSINEKHWWRHR